MLRGCCQMKRCEDECVWVCGWVVGVAGHTVEDLMTNEKEVCVPSALVDISGLRCGSGSTLCSGRAGYNAGNLDKHSTGKDIITYTGLLDSPISHKLGIIENTKGSFNKVMDDGSSESENESVEDGATLTTGEEWRAQLNYRGFSHINAVQKATDNGGPEARDRFYEANLHNSELHGTPPFQTIGLC